MNNVGVLFLYFLLNEIIMKYKYCMSISLDGSLIMHKQNTALTKRIFGLKAISFISHFAYFKIRI